MCLCSADRENLRQWQQLADQQKDADDEKHVQLAITHKVEVKETNHKVKVTNHKVEGAAEDADEAADAQDATPQEEEEAEDPQAAQTLGDRSDPVVVLAGDDSESTEDRNLVSDTRTPSPES